MIDGELAFPDETPADAWRELRVGTPQGMVTVRRDRDQVVLVTWGNAAVDLVRVGRLMVGAFQMSDVPGANSVRVYGRLGGEAALLTTLSRDGRPTVYPWAAAPGGIQSSRC